MRVSLTGCRDKQHTPQRVLGLRGVGLLSLPSWGPWLQVPPTCHPMGVSRARPAASRGPGILWPWILGAPLDGRGSEVQGDVSRDLGATERQGSKLKWLSAPCCHLDCGCCRLRGLAGRLLCTVRGAGPGWEGHLTSLHGATSVGARVQARVSSVPQPGRVGRVAQWLLCTVILADVGMTSPPCPPTPCPLLLLSGPDPPARPCRPGATLLSSRRRGRRERGAPTAGPRLWPGVPSPLSAQHTMPTMVGQARLPPPPVYSHGDPLQDCHLVVVGGMGVWATCPYLPGSVWA